MVRIILIGYMGAGKTTVGKALAAELGVPFYDLDWYITTRYRRTIPEIFAQQGEEGFRELERKMLHEAAEFEDIVLSCGGGTPCFFDNMEYMNSLADTIYLKAEPEILAQHLKMGKGKRPLIEGKTPEELEAYIQESLQAREPFYSQAKYTLDISLLDTFSKIDECVKIIKDMLKV
ncbi:MAG: shikimate kinase [Bacteroidaceae bacterium]|nr:shikimate kinase [Bacteroidaceae bacterium]MBR1755124.1 shikimate kinase [Bacteroidaceae bacterium]